MEKFLWIPAVVIFLGSFLLAPAYPAGPDNAGKALYERHCAMCHGADGKGNGPGAVSLPKKPTDFTDPAFWSKNADKKILDTINNGHESMPPIKMKPEQVKAVADYMSRTFKK